MPNELYIYDGFITNGSGTITGSFNVSGSTTQIGNNTLLGNTTLTGSVTISGSVPPGSLSASIQIYGDIRQSGYHRFDPVTTNIDTSISASYIYVSSSTNDLYFSQNSAGYANATRLRWIEGNLYSGLLHGGIITQSGSTAYRVSSGSGIIVTLNTSYNEDPYPTVQFLEWPTLTGTINSLSSSYDQQFIAISSSAGTPVIVAQGTPYNDGDYNTSIPIGIVIHQNRSSINAVQTFPSTAYGWKQRSYDFVKAFGPLKISGYTLSASGSSTGSLLLSGGTAFVEGRNYIVDPNNPSYIVEANGITTSKIYKYYQSGSNSWVYDTNNGSGYTAIDPTKYSNAGTLTSVGSNKWSIQRVYYFPNSATKAFYIYYGNAQYDNKLDALAALTTETFTEAPNTLANAIFVGYMVLRDDANFNTAASYEFRAAGMFRGSSAGGGSTGGATALTNLTDVSVATPADGDLLRYNSVISKWTNTKTLTGSYTLSGSLSVNGSLTGSLFGTASKAATASSVTALNQNVIITGSLDVSGSVTTATQLRALDQAAIGSPDPVTYYVLGSLPGLVDNLYPNVIVGSNIISGSKRYAIDSHNGISFIALDDLSNDGTSYQVARASIDIVNLNNESENTSADLTFRTQNSGSAMTDKMLISKTGNVSILSGSLNVSNTISGSRLYLSSSANGIVLANERPASNGSQAASPGIVFQGNGWNTTAGGYSSNLRYRINLVPVQGTSTDGKLDFQYSTDDGNNFASRASIDKDGLLIGAIRTNLINTAGQIAALTATNNTILKYNLVSEGTEFTPNAIFGSQSLDSGYKTYAFDTTNGFTFIGANGANERIARAGIDIVNLNNTTSNESADLAFRTQLSGSAMTTKMIVTATGSVLIPCGSLGIGTTTPNSGSLHVAGNVFANSFTGSLFGTSSRAVTASFALSSDVTVKLTAVDTLPNTGDYFMPIMDSSGNIYKQSALQYNAASGTISTTVASASNVIFGPYNEPGVAPYELGYSIVITPYGADGTLESPNELFYDPFIRTITVTSSFATTASFVRNAVTASYVLNAVSASRATTASYVLNAVSTSFASTASFVNTLNQNVLITGSLTVGSSSLGTIENTLTLGPPIGGTSVEGGQIGFQAAPSSTSASFIDQYQDGTGPMIRILKGTNAGSQIEVAKWNIHTRQMILPGYTATNSYAGTVAGLLAFDSSGNILTTTASTGGGGGGSGTVNSGVAGYLAYYPSTGTTVDDTSGLFWDAATSRLGIGTATPNSGALHVSGGVFANSFTGSLLGTASYALDGGVPYVASTGLTSTTGAPPEEGGPAPVNFSVNLSTGISGGQSVIGGTGLAENLTLSSTTNAGKGSIRFGSSSYLESSDYLGINQLIPTSRLHINTNQTGSIQSDANGILLANSTAATANTQSISPGIVFQGNGWKTATTASSQDVRFRIDVLPVQGSATASANLQIASNINSAGYRTGFTLSSAGDISILSGSLNVAQNITGSRMYLSSSNGTATGSTLIVYGSGSAQPVFAVQGSQGQLFSVTDSLSGSLFSVNDISGLPILRVLSDSTTLIGNYPTLMLTTTARVVQTSAGSFVVYSLPTGSYNTAFFEYSAQSGSNARAGTIVAFQSGNFVNYTETTTTDFGSTSTISFGVFVTGSNFALTGSCSTANWTIKTIIRGI